MNVMNFRSHLVHGIYNNTKTPNTQSMKPDLGTRLQVLTLIKHEIAVKILKVVWRSSLMLRKLNG